jgi:hypothetical protein
MANSRAHPGGVSSFGSEYGAVGGKLGTPVGTVFDAHLIPPPLINQLRAGGKMVIPVGLPGAQQLVALANALDKKGALSFEEYRDALLSMYREMPHEDASGDAGLIFDGVLSQLERVIRNPNRQT